MPIIVLSGVPGTGKSLIMDMICNRLGERAYCLTASKVAIESELDIAYDFKRDTFIVDEDALEERLRNMIMGRDLVLIETMDPCLLSDISDFVVVTRCSDIKALENRLRSKGWKADKVNENLEAEMLGVVEELAYACKERDKVHVVDTCVERIEDIVETVLSILEGG